MKSLLFKMVDKMVYFDIYLYLCDANGGLFHFVGASGFMKHKSYYNFEVLYHLIQIMLIFIILYICISCLCILMIFDIPEGPSPTFQEVPFSTAVRGLLFPCPCFLGRHYHQVCIFIYICNFFFWNYLYIQRRFLLIQALHFGLGLTHFSTY